MQCLPYVHSPGLKQIENITATIGRGFLHLEGEWPLSGTGPLACQDTEHPWLWTLKQEGTRENGWAGCLLCYVSVGFSYSLRVSSIVSA